MTAAAGLISAIAALIGGLIAAGLITVSHTKAALTASGSTSQSLSGSSSGSHSGGKVSSGGSSGGSTGNTGSGNGSTGNTGSGNGTTGNTGSGNGTTGNTGSGNGSTGNTGSGNGGSGNGDSGPAVISGVSFAGDTAAPIVIVSGQGFGSTSPAGQLNNSTNCGSYTNNGDDYGTENLWFEDGSNFAAGIGTPPNGTCVGIIILTWSSTQVTYEFGNAYNSFAHWYISAGDQYTLSVDGAQYSGTVSFTTD